MLRTKAQIWGLAVGMLNQRGPAVLNRRSVGGLTLLPLAVVNCYFQTFSYLGHASSGHGWCGILPPP